MIIGVGIDHARIERVRDLLERHPERSRDRLFTDAERRACEGRQRVPECYAARFAAKEAFVKALGTGLREGMRWTDIEVSTNADGRPELVLHREAASSLERVGGGRVHLSFTHEGGVAAAIVVIEASLKS
jgi:holo-[acyl-carrier protein] synthase